MLPHFFFFFGLEKFVLLVENCLISQKVKGEVREMSVQKCASGCEEARDKGFALKCRCTNE